MKPLKNLAVSLLCRLFGLVLAPFLLAKPSKQAPASILILKPCCIGDVLMATAAIGQLRRAFPKARMAMAVGAWSKEAVAGNPGIDEFVECGQVGSGRSRMADYRGLIDRIREGKFDACFVLDRSPILSLIPFMAGVPRRIGLDSGGRGFSLTDRVPCPPNRSEAELYLDCVRALGVSLKDPRMEFFPTETDFAWARERLAAKDRRRVAIHPGGGVNPGMKLPSKRWLPARFAEIARRLLEQGDSVVLVGAASERDVAEEVKASMRQADEVIDLTGVTSLGQLGAVLHECDLFIGNDSGPTHLAAAAGIPVIAVFGPSDPSLYRPFSDKSRVIYKGVSCGPCFGQGRTPGPCSHIRCILEITVDEVWQAVEELLKDV